MVMPGKAGQKSYNSLGTVGVPQVMTTKMMQGSCLAIFAQFSFLKDLPLKTVMVWCFSIYSGGLLKVFVTSPFFDGTFYELIRWDYCGIWKLWSSLHYWMSQHDPLRALQFSIQGWYTTKWGAILCVSGIVLLRWFYRFKTFITKGLCRLPLHDSSWTAVR